MTENDPQNGNKGFLQKVLDKFKSTSKEVADKVEDTIDDMKESEFGEKVSNAANAVSDKAKDMIQDVKDSEFADKLDDMKDAVVDKARDLGGDVTNFCADKMKKVIGKINFDETLSSLRERQEKTGRDMSGLINFVEKLQNIK